MSASKQLVTVIIPCYNEAASIEKVVHDFHASQLANTAFQFDLLVVDNASIDGTAEVAARAGARVITETRRGKGFAVRTGFANIAPQADYAVMIDGDDTYAPQEVLRLLEPLYHDFSDVVIGSRLGGKIHGESMTYLNRAGNWGFTHMVRLLYRTNVTDVLSGYFAWKRSAVEGLSPLLSSAGFSIEMEMITKMARLHYMACSVPISYRQRSGETSLRPFRDGLRILSTLARNIRWEPRTTPFIQELPMKEEA